MEQKPGKVSVPMTALKRPQEPATPGHSSSYTSQSYTPGPKTLKAHTSEPQPPKSYLPEPQASKSYPPDLYGPKSYPPDQYGPKSYPPDQYGSTSYLPDQYGPTSYPPDLYTPAAPSAPPHYETSDGCSYTVEIISGECPSPPPYSCEEVSCHQIGPACCSGSQPPVVVAGIFSCKPASTICPCCREIITTEVIFRVGPLTYALCTCICLIGCCLGCCLIPFVSNCSKDVDHYCPCCRYHIYRYKRL